MEDRMPLYKTQETHSQRVKYKQKIVIKIEVGIVKIYLKGGQVTNRNGCAFSLQNQPNLISN